MLVSRITGPFLVLFLYGPTCNMCCTFAKAGKIFLDDSAANGSI